MRDQPSASELVTAVREFIENHAMPQLHGHAAFHARVAANALAIVTREFLQSEAANAGELHRLKQLLGSEETLENLNRELCLWIRSGQLAPNDRALADHLCATALAQIAIDQPTYSGFLHSPHRANVDDVAVIAQSTD